MDGSRIASGVCHALMKSILKPKKKSGKLKKSSYLRRKRLQERRGNRLLRKVRTTVINQENEFMYNVFVDKAI